MSIDAVMVHPAASVRGHVRPPGDKSISHRYALLAAIAEGTSVIRGYSTGGDCASTLRCLERLGVRVREIARKPPAGLDIEIQGLGVGGLKPPAAVLDAGNSGSTIRMLAGILAAQSFATSITGDESLQRRPMRRVIVPLEQMGARVASDDGRPPLRIEGTPNLAAIDYAPDVPSAQVKSAVLLAGLHARGTTRVREPLSTRDHTDRALRLFGATVSNVNRTVSVEGGPRSTRCAHPCVRAAR